MLSSYRTGADPPSSAPGHVRNLDGLDRGGGRSLRHHWLKEGIFHPCPVIFAAVGSRNFRQLSAVIPLHNRSEPRAVACQIYGVARHKLVHKKAKV